MKRVLIFESHLRTKQFKVVSIGLKIVMKGNQNYEQLRVSCMKALRNEKERKIFSIFQLLFSLFSSILILNLLF